MIFRQLGDRFRRIANRQPAPQPSDGLRELSRLGAQGAQAWFATKLEPTPAQVHQWASQEMMQFASEKPAPKFDESELQRIENEKKKAEDYQAKDIPKLNMETMELQGESESDGMKQVIWWENWENLARFIAVKHPERVPGGYTLSCGRAHQYKEFKGVTTHSWAKEDFQALAEDYAAVCDVLHDLSSDEPAVSEPKSEPIRAEDGRVRVKDKWFTVTPEQFIFIESLIQAHGHFVSSTDLRKAEHPIARPDRIKKNLPEEISSMIEGKTGAGYRLTCYDVE